LSFAIDDPYPVKRKVSHKCIQTLSKSTYEKHKHNDEIASKDLHTKFKKMREYSKTDDTYVSIEDKTSYDLVMRYDLRNSISAKNADMLAQEMEHLYIQDVKKTSDVLVKMIEKNLKKPKNT